MRHKLILLTLSTVLTLGCAKNVTAPVPGSAGTFDSNSYLTLVTTDNVIQNTKADLASNAFPAGMSGAIKTALNGLIASYDVANPIYQAYHAAALTGTATPTQQTAVANALSDVQAKTIALTSAKGGH